MPRRVTLAAAMLALALGAAQPAGAAVKAGAAVVDASWHVGASAGQYATTKADDPSSDFAEFDPNALAVKNNPSYGIQSRLQARALAVQGADGKTFAIAKIDLYIPQDLLWRRAAQILQSETNGVIGESNLTMVATHDHSSPYYSSTGIGAWTFQDVFDVRFYNYYARKIADAVEAALKNMVPARMGATVTSLDTNQQNVPGPALADNGTPAGYPRSYSDHAVSVVRFDSLAGKPIGQLVSYSLHGESLDGNDLISADWVAPFQRMLDRETGGVTVYMQDAVGNSETEENTYHQIHQRLFFEHKQYQQTERNGRLLADAAYRAWKEIGQGTPDANPPNPEPYVDNPSHFVGFMDDFKVDELDRWFFGPVSHPVATVGNCRTDPTLQGDIGAPGAGLPDCGRPQDLGAPDTSLPFDPGVDAEKLAGAGIPVPANYGVPGDGALEEALGIHLQTIRLGPVLLTICSCEQWNDQAQNIRTRTDKVPGNEWLGFNWADPARPGNDGSPGCEQASDGTWSCPNPSTQCTVDEAGVHFCPDPAHPDSRLTGLSDHDYQVMESQVLNDAAGWNDPTCMHVGCGLQAESEPADPTQIYGGYTHDDTTVRGGADQTADYASKYGYTLTIPVSMANDYNGYIASYREFQRGDHYRKALTGWGPHSSDYLAMHLSEMAHALNGDSAALAAIDKETDPAKADPIYGPLSLKEIADRQYNDARATALGTIGENATAAYARSLPDDGGTPGTAVEQPKDVQRFDAAFFSWVGGDNFTDMPSAVVQRQGDDGTWSDYADQSGELPVTLKFPDAASADIPTYAAGSFKWVWTATFEAFVSGGGYDPYDLGDRPAATPPGTYRFKVTGLDQAGHAQAPYALTSKPFQVGAWSKVSADGVREDPGGTVSFTAGPIHDRLVPGSSPAARVEVGPIDYDDTYDKAAGAHGVRFVRGGFTRLTDPAAPNDPSLAEWYCLNCSFRPWLDFAPAARATVTFVNPSTGKTVRAPAHVERSTDASCPVGPIPGAVPGTGLCDRWVTTRKLGSGESAYVCPGDLQDAWGDYNGQISGSVEPSSGGGTVALDCKPLAEIVDGPVVGGGGGQTPGGNGPAGDFGSSAGPGGVGPGETGAAEVLGLPSTHICASRRSFRIRVRAPQRGVKLRQATIYVNGHRVRVLRGKRIRAKVNLRGLPRGTFAVRIVVTTTAGRRYASTRRYHTCTGRRLQPKHHAKL